MTGDCCGNGVGKHPDDVDDRSQRAAVRSQYGSIATGTDSGCCGDDSDEYMIDLGYDPDSVDAATAAANMGLGCGNPTAIAELESGETVLDLGSGGGFDCFLAAEEVGEEGEVVGVDMTPEMVDRAREIASDTGASNVEFRLGEIEHLPVADERVDVVLSNCVVNLSPEKEQVFEEAYRVLRSGGRLAITDVVQTASLPDGVASDLSAIASCVGDLETIDSLETMIRDAGFEGVTIEPKEESEQFISEWSPARDPSEYALSARIEARKP